jgi:integrase
MLLQTAPPQTLDDYFYLARHIFATLQLSNGTDIYTVSKLLRHTSVNTTQIYAKMIDEKKGKGGTRHKTKYQQIKTLPHVRLPRI